MNKQVALLNVYIPVGTAKFPDPAKIQNTGQWYLLGHISSSLARFDHITGSFEPMLADYEIYPNGIHSFTLREDAKFSDGSAVQAADVVASIKRLLIRKTSTHFPLWEYIEDCDSLKSLSDQCTGLRAVGSKRIEIRLKHHVESFLLQMSSPESGIWAEGDIDPVTLEIKATKYSGPYSLGAVDEGGFTLIRNPSNIISKEFMNSPLTIRLRIMKSDVAGTELENGNIDLLVRSHNPYEALRAGDSGIEVFRSSPSTLLYLHGAGSKPKNLLSREFVEALWKNNTDNGISPADTFLPFDPAMSLTRAEFLKALVPRSELHAAKPVRVGVPWTYLSKGFYDFLAATAKSAELPFEIVELTREEWIAALEQGEAPHGIDFVLGIYAASERYPAVQLRYITGTVRGPKIDLKPAETPELSPEKKELLRSYQKDLVRNGYAVPLFLARHQIMYRKHLDVGDQPPSDAEVELWRVVRR